MFYLNRFPVNLESCDASSFDQCEKTEEFITRRGFHHQYQEESIIIADTNCQYIINQNDILQDCIKGCQVLGFIPDHTTSEYPSTQSCYNHSLGYQNQLTRANKEYYSSKPTQNSLRVNLKRKRSRTSFTTAQIVFLEGVFQMKPYITRAEMVVIMKKLQLSQKAIKMWFQNRRRMTDKKYRELTPDSPSSEDSQDSYSDRLAFIETKIQENTDENGYVTLNDNIMRELVSAIHDYLTKDVYHCDSQPLPNSSTTEDFVMYEPISPASSDVIEII